MFLPSSVAAIWSAEMPAWMPAPSVFLGWTPVSQVAPSRAWSPAPSPSARPLHLRQAAEARCRCSRNGSSAFMVGVNSKPVPFGGRASSLSRIMPFGMIDEPQADRRPSRRAGGRQRRDHGVQQRQRQRGAETAQERAARQDFLVMIMVPESSSSEMACSSRWR